MAEIYKAKIYGTDEEIEIKDPEPLEAAKLFLETSDAIWNQEDDHNEWAMVTLASQLEPMGAQHEMDRALRVIDTKLCVSGLTEALHIGGFRDEEKVFAPSFFNQPSQVGVGTFNWDARNTHRVIRDGNGFIGAEFTDGHVDYSRELYANFIYQNEHDYVSVTHSLQRAQRYQDSPTTITTNVWVSDFAETGYEGSPIAHAEMTNEQEIAVLNVLRRMAGQAIDHVA